MIYFITGKPRHGKGLYSLKTIQAKAQRENRQVYYMGIYGLKFDWIQLDKVEDWPQLPHGSIIVFDECHNFFPQEKVGSNLPYHVSFLAEHAHNGYDMFFITQNPKRVSTFLRDRVEEHHHLIRIFGKEKSNLYKFYDIQNIPLSKAAKQDGIKSKFEFPKELYDQYTSSNMHNVKQSAPLRHYALYPILLCAAGLAYYGFHSMKSQSDKKEEQKNTELTTQNPFTNNINNDKQKPELTYIQAHVPEVPDLAYTAPIYKEIIKPTVAPYPAACVLMHGKCKCYTQQATHYEVTETTCRQIVENGFFVEWEQKTAESGRNTASKNGVSGRSPDVDQQSFDINRKTSRASPNNSSPS